MSGSEPWYANPDRPAGDARQYAPAVARNRDAILAVLREELIDGAKVLELASGSGEHAAYFAKAMSRIDWQPSDSSPAALASIAAWRDDAGGPANLLMPIALDVAIDSFPDGQFDAIFIANLTHIAPFDVTRRLFEKAAGCLKRNGTILIYGPFFRDDAPPSEGDRSFDAKLRARDARLGIRHIDEVDEAARAGGFQRSAAYPMPANNLTLIYSCVSAG